MYKLCGKKMGKVVLLFSLVMLCASYIAPCVTAAYARTPLAEEEQLLKADQNLEVLKKESDLAWEKIIQEKLDPVSPNKPTDSPDKPADPKDKQAADQATHGKSSKITGTYPETPGTILVTKDWYGGLVPLGHAAMVCDKLHVVEALSHGITIGKNDWYATRKTAFGLKVRNTSEKQNKEAAEWCKKQVKKPYNFAYWNPNRRDAFYCSQLVWAAYKDVHNIDIATQKRFGAIYPPDLVNSDALKEVYAKIT